MLDINNISLTANGYEFLQGYLTELYGERGTFRHNLERFASSEEFQSACHYAEKLDDIHEISLQTLISTVEREERFINLSKAIIEKYDDIVSKRHPTFDEIYEIAGILGLAPGQTDWYDTLLPHVCDLFFPSKAEAEMKGRELEDEIRKKPGIFDVMVSTILNGMRPGQLLKNSVDDRTIFSQGYTRNLWRGENAYHVKCLASMYRNRPTDQSEALIHDIVAEIKMIEFSIWLCSLEFVKKWPYGDVFHGAIAQHYGIPTNAIDVTGDLKSAIFFACTKYEKEKNSFRTLTPDEYTDTNSRPHIARIHGDSRYGILFKAPFDIINMSLASKDPQLHFTSAFPIGNQPFMRCNNQSGYVIETGYPFDLYKDGCFAKFKFRLTPEVCNWIFDIMDGGKNIYPDEVFGNIDAIVEKINTSKVFSMKAFDMVLERKNIINEKAVIEKSLFDHGITLVPELEWCTEEYRTELESTFWENSDKLNERLPQPNVSFKFTITKK